MKIIGYGICGPGEAGRYLKETLDDLKRLCDEVIILCNNTTAAEHALIDSYGFTRYSDRRQWGHFQYRIKQDFLETVISKRAAVGDMMVCLDMDETFDSKLTREWIQKADLDAYHFYVVDLWGDGYKPESCFWNVRLWRWNGETKFKQTPVHCGLAPEWTYKYHRFAPFLLLHKGLKEKEDRERKIERYRRYDPDAKYMDRRYYKMLESDTFAPFNEDEIHAQVEKEVETYQQKRPTHTPMPKPKERFAYVENAAGITVDIPEKHLAETLKQKGMKFIGFAEDGQQELEELFAEIETEEEEIAVIEEKPDGSYHPLDIRAETPGEKVQSETTDEEQEVSAPVEPPEETPKRKKAGSKKGK